MKIAIILILILLLTISCTTLTDIRTTNTRNLLKLNIGMTKNQVIEVMADDELTVYDSRGTGLLMISLLLWPLLPFQIFYFEDFSNPYRYETFVTSTGDHAEVLFYYTDRKAADDAITDDELTPLVLKDGKLVGWGWLFLKGDVDYHNIEIQVR